MSANWERWHRATSEFAAAASACCVAVVALAYTAEVVARYFFGAPFNWSGDLSGYLLCVGGFLALPKVTSEGAHISVSFLVERLSARPREIYLVVLAKLSAIVCASVAGIIAIEGARLFAERVLTSHSNQIPKWWLAAFACYGLASAALHLWIARPEAPGGSGGA